MEFQVLCQPQHLQQGHLQHPPRPQTTVGHRRRSDHRPCGVGCRQPRYVQLTARSLLCRTDIRGHDTRGRRRKWAALRATFKGGSREAIHAKHAKMSNISVRSRQDSDEYLHIMDSCRDRPSTCDPPENATERSYEYFYPTLFYRNTRKAIRQARLERGNFGLADI